MFTIQNVLVRREITETQFVCDLHKCKGACCTFESKYGAPLHEDEIGKINNILSMVKKYITNKGIEHIEKNGFYSLVDGELLIDSIDNKECVFVFYDDGIAKCGIEKAYYNMETDFKKPISCHLFPIRVSKFGGDVLRYERINECNPALKRGASENVTVAEFCEEPLTRSYGNKWYSELKEVIGR